MGNMYKAQVMPEMLNRYFNSTIYFVVHLDSEMLQNLDAERVDQY